MGTKYATDRMIGYARDLWRERDMSASYFADQTYDQQFREVYLPNLKVDKPGFADVSNAIDFLRHAPYKTDDASADGEYFGQIGQKLTITATVTEVNAMTKNGRSFAIVKMRTECGKTVAFFDSALKFADCYGDGQSKVGRTVTVKATVKEHSTFRGQKQTMLSHVHVETRLGGFAN